MAKMANGMANDLASTLLMATDKPVLIAPAMNVRMWQHPATQRNLAVLQRDGILVVGPDDGNMACGEFGPGRMSEVPDIIAAASAALGQGPLAGKHIIVTSGPTHEPIDPVRYIANRSSGAQGTALAIALRDLGANVSFVTGPATAPRPNGVTIIEVQTAAQMYTAIRDALPADAAVFAAAVADWHVLNAADAKIKKSADGALPSLSFAENPDILAIVSQLLTGRPPLVVGFAAETSNVVDNAKGKLVRKGCDWIVANDVSSETGIMGGSENKIHLVTANGVEDWPRLTKVETARRLAVRIADTLAPKSA
jgi:phosphopantothenoylcysteine decarboxylase/phosphopantothenate--cysteine ligase